jgi:hypothetical protein
MNELLKDPLAINRLEDNSIEPEDHIAAVKKLDYAKTIERLKNEPKPKGYPYEGIYMQILEYKDDYKPLFDEHLTTYINEHFENAYKFKSEEAKSIKEITAAKDLIDAASMMLPEDEAVKKLKAEVDKAYESLAGPYYKKVYTSDFHKENVGKILFSNKPIVAGQEDPAQFKTKFSITERIYGIVYLKGTVKGLFNGNTTGMYKINLAGKSDFIYFEHIPVDMNKSYYIIEILPDPAIATHADDAGNFPWRLAGLSPRTHHLEIAYADKKVAFGEIDIDCSGIDSEKIKAEGKLSKKNAADNLARLTMLPKSFGDATKAFKDPGLSYTNMKKILKNRWENCASIIKVAAYGTDNNDWYTEKNNLGIPKGKGTTREIKAIYKGKDGWCYYVEEIGFQRIYSGGGKYSSVKFWKDGEHVKIDCKNVK